MNLFSRLINRSSNHHENDDDYDVIPLSKSWHGGKGSSTTNSKNESKTTLNYITNQSCHGTESRPRFRGYKAKRPGNRLVVADNTTIASKLHTITTIPESRPHNNSNTNKNSKLTPKDSNLDTPEKQPILIMKQNSTTTALTSTNQSNKNEEITFNSSMSEGDTCTTKRRSQIGSQIEVKALPITPTTKNTAAVTVLRTPEDAPIPSEILLSFDDGRDVEEGEEENVLDDCDSERPMLRHRLDIIEARDWLEESFANGEAKRVGNGIPAMIEITKRKEYNILIDFNDVMSQSSSPSLSDVSSFHSTEPNPVDYLYDRRILELQIRAKKKKQAALRQQQLLQIALQKQGQQYNNEDQQTGDDDFCMERMVL